MSRRVSCALRDHRRAQKILKFKLLLKTTVMPAKAGIHAFLKTTKKPNHPNHLNKPQIPQKAGTFHFYELYPIFGRPVFEIFFTNNKLGAKKQADAPRGAFLTF